MASITNLMQPQNYIVSGSSAAFTGVFKDFALQPIGSASFSSMTLTIIDPSSGSIINTVSDTNILNIDRGTVDSAGNLTITLTPGDTDMFDPDSNFEPRRLLIEYTYSGGIVGRQIVEFGIVAAVGVES